MEPGDRVWVGQEDGTHYKATIVHLDEFKCRVMSAFGPHSVNPARLVAINPEPRPALKARVVYVS
ncbi:MAG TPA: hypothetical protein VKT27_06115 [Candidatus Binataceae bacterium]|nr:hypothetical protein [Candidatus Binataceae bacterium]